ncbi:hypothetical protein JCM19992_00550 [Thermostilla marina]
MVAVAVTTITAHIPELWGCHREELGERFGYGEGNPQSAEYRRKFCNGLLGLPARVSGGTDSPFPGAKLPIAFASHERKPRDTFAA